MIRDHAAAFLLALQFLTRIPVPIDIYSREREAASVCYYPAVGLLIGALNGTMFLLADLWFATPLAVLLSMAFGLLLTGAFHEDGLADTWDGMGGGADRSRTLEIMQDSRLGTYGTAALVSVLALKASALMALPPAIIPVVLVAGHGLSRFSSVVAVRTGTYVRDHGSAKHTASGISPGGLALAGLAGASSLLILGKLGTGYALCAAIGCLAGHSAMCRIVSKKLHGYTGDTLGAVQQTSELGIYLAVAAGVS